MDINSLRGLATLIALMAFIAVCLWAYSARKKKDFSEAAQLPFADDPPHFTPNNNKTDNQKGDNIL